LVFRLACKGDPCRQYQECDPNPPAPSQTVQAPFNAHGFPGGDLLCGLMHPAVQPCSRVSPPVPLPLGWLPRSLRASAGRTLNPHTRIECSSWTTRLIARFRAGQQTKPTHLGLDQPSLTRDSLTAQPLEGWRSPLDSLFHPCSCPLFLSESGKDVL
jgi:hypothetical protein